MSTSTETYPNEEEQEQEEGSLNLTFKKRRQSFSSGLPEDEDFSSIKSKKKCFSSDYSSNNMDVNVPHQSLRDETMLSQEKSAIAEEFRFRKNKKEIRQRKENELKFNKLKKIIQIAPLTISEIKELAEVLNTKRDDIETSIKLENYKTSKLDNGIQIQTPLLSGSILQNIFSHLSITDLKNCRLVSNNWWIYSTLELRKYFWIQFCSFYKKTTSKFWSKNNNQFGRFDYDLLTKFVHLAQKSKLLPVVSFNLTLDYPNPEDEPIIKTFFKLVGPILENLIIDFKYLSNDFTFTVEWDIKNYLQNICLEKLKRLEFDFSGCRYFQYEDTCRVSFITTCLNATPNVEYLLFYTDLDSCELLDSLENAPLVHLKNLKLHSWTLEDKELQRLNVFKFKYLSLKIEFIHFKSSTMKDFLMSQSTNLEYLKLLAYDVKTKFYYEFPIMENLKILSIEYSKYVRTNRKELTPADSDDETNEFSCSQDETLRFKTIDWSICFPKLQEFHIRNGCEKYWPQVLFSKESNVNHSVKKLAIPKGFHKYIDEYKNEISRIFPNIQILMIPYLNIHVTSICPCLSKLKTIIFEVDNPHDINSHICKENNILKNINEILKKFIWDLNFDNLNLMEINLKDVTQTILEIKFKPPSGSYMEILRKTYDCTWFLRLLRERKKLEIIELGFLDNTNSDSNNSDTYSQQGEIDKSNDE